MVSGMSRDICPGCPEPPHCRGHQEIFGAGQGLPQVNAVAVSTGDEGRAEGQPTTALSCRRHLRFVGGEPGDELPIGVGRMGFIDTDGRPCQLVCRRTRTSWISRTIRDSMRVSFVSLDHPVHYCVVY